MTTGIAGGTPRVRAAGTIREPRSVHGLPGSTSIELRIRTCGATAISVDVAETAEELRIPVETEGGDGPECLDSVAAELDEPLGDRRVVDVSTGEEVEVFPADG